MRVRRMAGRGSPFTCPERILLSFTVPLPSLRAGPSFSSLHTPSFQVTFSADVSKLLGHPRVSAPPALPRRFHPARLTSRCTLARLRSLACRRISTLHIALSVLLLWLPGQALTLSVQHLAPGRLPDHD